MTANAEVRMLWEAVDPADALTARFGFADSEHAVAWLDETLRVAWALRIERCDRLVISASNLLAWLRVDGRDMIAKCCADTARFERLAYIDALVGWLDAKGIPVATAIAADDGRLRVERDGFSVGLYPVVAGDLLDVDDELQVAAAGRLLATLHEVLATYPHPSPPGRQLVHGDFRSANILYDGARITAVVDFDEVRVRSRIADLAQAAVLLATRYHDWAPTSPQTRADFVAAYAEVAPLTAAERDQLHDDVAALLGHFGWA